MRAEEIPEPDEPEEEPEEEPGQAGAAVATALNVGMAAREFEFKTDEIPLEKIADGTTLAEALTEASKDGWDFMQLVDAGGDRRLMLFRRAKRAERKGHPVGFLAPSRS